MNSNQLKTNFIGAGYRLYSFEIWNWGTFDNQIWKIDTNGESSLLTGANASGKTTLVDGLLTLLVPERRMRFYNQTAGSKGERSEESYLTGEYGEVDNAQTKAVEVRRLRHEKEKTQSVLLAVFFNGYDWVTLAQARWYRNNDLKRTFVFARQVLTIEKDFSPFDNQGAWKKRIREKYNGTDGDEVVMLINSPREYGRLMREEFGMRSVKAHTLFSQTIGLKVLGNLDDFVRRQMLEELDAETEFQNLITYFNTLNDAHLAIEKVAVQIQLLKPLVKKSESLEELELQLKQQEELLTVIPRWFGHQKKEMLIQDIESAQWKCQQLEEKVNAVQMEIDQLAAREREVDIMLSTDNTEKQLDLLCQREKVLQNMVQERKEERELYEALAEGLGIETSVMNEERFGENRQKAEAIKMQQLSNLDSLAVDRNTLVNQIREIDENLETFLTEKKRLESSSHNITGTPARIREQITAHLAIDIAELPFIGELIQVDENEKQWELAIEKILHHFALRLLVPAEHYEKVNQYVNNHDLRGKIVYHKVANVETDLFNEEDVDGETLGHKLVFREHPYKGWLQNKINQIYDYQCVESIEEFKRCTKAVLKSGLMKQHSRHEKDDRQHVNSRQNYVLGWDNREKIAHVESEIRHLQEALSLHQQQLIELEERKEGYNSRLEMTSRFLDFQSYLRIACETDEELVMVAKQIEELNHARERNPLLRKEHEEVLAQIDERETQLEALKKQWHQAEDRMSRKRKMLEELEEQLSEDSIQASSDLFHQLETNYLKGKMTGLKVLEREQKRVSEEVAKIIDQVKEQWRKDAGEIEALMRAFIHPDKSIADQFPDWGLDTDNLTADVNQLEDYKLLLRRIQDEDLVQYRRRFKSFLNEEMITRMADFYVLLLRQEEDIEINIQTLNKSLEKINFQSHPVTFIQLRSVKEYSPNVKVFKSSLKEWKPGLNALTTSQDEAVLEKSFQSIKNVLDSLSQDDAYRKEVLDVRNWMKFKAVEYLRADSNVIQRTYTGTAKLSGGEGAQLTYTILGSAIAYQFGIHNTNQDRHSFRFICVDEAFSKQDDEKARFLMELCQQLNLQLMVVSPAKAEEVAIVEPYISRVHFVQRRNNRESMVFDMLIKQLN